MDFYAGYTGVREQIIANAIVIFEKKSIGSGGAIPQAEDFNIVLKTVGSRNVVGFGYHAVLMKKGLHGLESEVLISGDVSHYADGGPYAALNALANLLNDTCRMASETLGA